ncbi:MAG: metallophosphoesterase [Xanthobacteraceae bacterium]|nr:metallophosphoesterase [Xanthobacteraceae bacterium]
MISRRTFFSLLGGAFLGGAGMFSYALFEPRYRLVTTTYRFIPPLWPKTGKPLRIAALADLHACDPWMPLPRIEEIVRVTNALKPDLVVLLGDYVSGIHRFKTAAVEIEDWTAALAKLEAPIGKFAVLGNHDWWENPEGVRKGLENNGIPVLENEALKLRAPDGTQFWLAGLGDQLAYGNARTGYRGVHDLPKTMRAITDDSPVILLAHEPDIFPQVSERVSLTLCGHTHGGQIRLPFFGAPVVPSRFGQRYAYGHIVEENRHLVVSGGLGCTFLPVRFGSPPEAVLLELG